MKELIVGYRSAYLALIFAKESTFPRGSTVRVEQKGRYCGHGTVRYDEGCPPDKLSVLLPNGNTWWYDIECCVPVPEAVTMLKAEVAP